MPNFRRHGLTAAQNQPSTPQKNNTPRPSRQDFSARRWLGNFKRPSRGRSFDWKRIARLVLTTGAALVLISLLAVAWVSRDLPSPERLANRQVAQSTKIYDRTGTHLLYEAYNDEKRTLVKLNQIAPLAAKATIATEDRLFYEHNGVRLPSILRARFFALIGRKSGAGGGSTLTQQLIKNTLVGSERRGLAGLLRKAKEAILAIRLERKYSKDQILELYLNEIPYGSTNYGIESASQSYFHKKAQDLSLPESATLAALIQRPSFFLSNPDSLRNRRDVVLRLMAEQGYITDEEKTKAQNEALRIFRGKGLFDAPHFVTYIQHLLENQLGPGLIDTGGLKVITTLDYDKQKLAEQIITEQGEKLAKTANANNSALVAIDPKTAQIIAMVGSRDYDNLEINGRFNVVTSGFLQPGSSFKPFVYAAAFEKGYTPETVVYDVLTDFDLRAGGAKYMPKNYDGKERGLVTFRQALQGSLNIPAVKAMYLVGGKQTVEFAKRFGYTAFTGDPDLTMVLGGHEVNMLEHANAYATLANQGKFHAPVGILKVESPSGETLLEWKPTPGSVAISPELAALTSNVLSDNNARAYVFGAFNNLVLPGRPVAAKTGTTNDSKDAWTLGYTHSLAAAVWVGNTPKRMPMKGGGNLLAGTIWNKFMAAALKNTPVEQFATSPANDATKPVLRGSDKGIVLPINSVTGKIASSSTPAELVTEKTFLPPHDILYYVSKDDPRGPSPQNPADDPQFSNWEAALRSWADRLAAAGKPVSFEEPPSEYDSIGSPELAPTISIESPLDGSTISNRQLNIQIKASAPRGVAKVVFSIDNFVIGESIAPPFSLSYYAKELTRGPHTLRVVAQDDQGNSAQKSITFGLDAPFDPASLQWFDASPLTLQKEDFPRVISLAPFRWDEIVDIKIYLSSGGDKKLIYTFNHQDKLLNNQLTFTWKNSPGDGSHALSAVLSDSSGRSSEYNLPIEVK